MQSVLVAAGDGVLLRVQDRGIGLPPGAVAWYVGAGQGPAVSAWRAGEAR